MKRSASSSFSTPEPCGTRIQRKVELAKALVAFTENPLEINPINQEPLLAEASKLANRFFAIDYFQVMLVNCGQDHYTCFDQARKIRVSFADPVRSENVEADTSRSWAWTMKRNDLDNTDIFINVRLKQQVSKFEIAPESLRWKKYVFMIATLIFHEFAHLCLRWMNKDSPYAKVNEIGTYAEKLTFESSFDYIFDKKPASKTEKGEWIIDDTIQLLDLTLSDPPKEPITNEYIEKTYAQSVKKQHVADFDLLPVQREETRRSFVKGYWRSRSVDESIDEHREAVGEQRRILRSPAASSVWTTNVMCPIAIERGLTYHNESSDEE